VLVLTRHLEQDIFIGDNIRVRVVAINGNQVRLGIEAPSSVNIVRGEIVAEVTRQNQAAVRSAELELPTLRPRPAE
jgi:carbon storage regulator